MFILYMYLSKRNVSRKYFKLDRNLSLYPQSLEAVQPISC